MKGTMDKVYKWENSASVNTATYAQQTKENLKYWRDDEFASELESNPYCKIYTSEENHMYYPTTTTATSGRFFVFGKGEDGQYLQPYVDGKIYSTFHTAFELWQKDYIKAIKTEKSAYTAWQYAENIKDALSHETTESHSHQYVCGVKKRLIEVFHGDCAEMEGASIAHGAYLNKIPFIVIRAISDKADGSAEMDYTAFEHEAAKHSARLVEDLVQKIQ